MVVADKGATLGFRSCREAAGGEGIVAQVFDQPAVVLSSRIHFITFPAAQGDGANLQELEPSFAKVAADARWLLWNWDSTVVGGQIALWETLTTHSQKGNVAHARWQDACRIALHASRNSKLIRAHLGATFGSH